MTVAASTLINGISATIVVALGAFLCIRFLIRFLQEKKGLMPYVSFLGFTLICFYLGPIVTFYSLVFTGHNIDVILYAQLSYTITPIAISNVMWMGFTIFNPDRRKLAVTIFLISAIPYYILLFVFPQPQIVLSGTSIAALDAAGEMIDISIIGALFVFNALYILFMIFFLTGGFYYLQQKITGIDKQKAVYLAAGFLVLGIAFILENALGSMGDVAKIAARVLTITSVTLFYLGFSAPKSAISNNQVKKSAEISDSE
jgi:hypothetical protein